MATRSGDRTAYFPAIEKKHGQPIHVWFERLDELGDDAKYPEQIGLLREDHGFSQAHANAVVMYHRGSASSQRFDGPEDLIGQLDEPKQTTVRRIVAAIIERHPEVELVVAWNQPMLRIDGDYVFGVSASANHLTISPWSTDVLHAFAERLEADPTFGLNKKTFTVPADWDVDVDLLDAMVTARRAELTP